MSHNLLLQNESYVANLRRVVFSFLFLKTPLTRGPRRFGLTDVSQARHRFLTWVTLFCSIRPEFVISGGPRKIFPHLFFLNRVRSLLAALPINPTELIAQQMQHLPQGSVFLNAVRGENTGKKGEESISRPTVSCPLAAKRKKLIRFELLKTGVSQCHNPH